jgi:penicillin amidase
LLVFVAPKDERASQALALVQKWDGTMDANRPEPVIFEAWLYAFHQRMLIQTLGTDMQVRGPFAASTLVNLVANHAQDWCGDNNCHDTISESFADAMVMMVQRQGNDITQWKWGQENVAMLRHKFYSHIPLLNKFSDLSVQSSGDFYTLDRGGGFENDTKHPFARTHGGGFRGIYDLANPEASLFMIATGESGHIFSPHYGDLVQKWVNVQGIALSGTAEELQRRGAEKLVLEP